MSSGHFHNPCKARPLSGTLTLMSNLRPIDASGNIVEKTQSVDALPTPSTVTGNVGEQLIQSAAEDAMGLETTSQKGASRMKIGTILEYVKTQTKDLSPENVKWVIRDLELRLGTPPFGESRVNQVARFAYLLLEQKKLEKEVDQLRGKRVTSS
jgi:hypothetical protein